MITDDIIVKMFFTNNGDGPMNSSLRRKFEHLDLANVSICDAEREIKQYLDNRFSDS